MTENISRLMKQRGTTVHLVPLIDRIVKVNLRVAYQDQRSIERKASNILHQLKLSSGPQHLKALASSLEIDVQDGPSMRILSATVETLVRSEIVSANSVLGEYRFSLAGDDNLVSDLGETRYFEEGRKVNYIPRLGSVLGTVRGSKLKNIPFTWRRNIFDNVSDVENLRWVSLPDEAQIYSDVELMAGIRRALESSPRVLNASYGIDERNEARHERLQRSGIMSGGPKISSVQIVDEPKLTNSYLIHACYLVENKSLGPEGRVEVTDLRKRSTEPSYTQYLRQLIAVTPSVWESLMDASELVNPSDF